MDLSQLTSDELDTLKTNLLASLNASAGAAEYTIDGRTLKRTSLTETAELLSKVNTEIRLRADTTGGLILTEFAEPE